MSNFLAQYLVDFATFLPSEEKVKDVIANASRLTTGLVNPLRLGPDPSPTKVLFGNNTWGDISSALPPDVVLESELAPIAFSGSASDLTTGTVPLLRLPSEVARKDLSNVFAQGNTFQATQVFESSICVGLGGTGPRIRQGTGQVFRLNNNADTARADLEVGNVLSTGTVQVGGVSGPLLKNSSGTLQVRNSADSAFATAEMDQGRVHTRLRVGTLPASSYPLEVNGYGQSYESTAIATGWLSRNSLSQWGAQVSSGGDWEVMQYIPSVFRRFWITQAGSVNTQDQMTTASAVGNHSLTIRAITSQTGRLLRFLNASSVDVGYISVDGSALFNGNITAASDVDSTHTFGRARISSSVADTAYFSHIDHANNTSFALRQESSGFVVVNGVSAAGGVQIRVGNSTAVSVPTTTQAVFNGNIQLGSSSGVRLNNNSGVLEVRNSADTLPASINIAGAFVRNNELISFADSTGSFTNVGITRLSTGVLRITGPSTTIEMDGGNVNILNFLQIGSTHKFRTNNSKIELRNSANDNYAPLVAGDLWAGTTSFGSAVTPANSRLVFGGASTTNVSAVITGRQYASNFSYGDLILSANPNIGVLDYSNLTDDLVVRGQTGNVEINRGNLTVVGQGTFGGGVSAGGGQVRTFGNNNYAALGIGRVADTTAFRILNVGNWWMGTTENVAVEIQTNATSRVSVSNGGNVTLLTSGASFNMSTGANTFSTFMGGVGNYEGYQHFQTNGVTNFWVHSTGTVSRGTVQLLGDDTALRPFDVATSYLRFYGVGKANTDLCSTTTLRLMTNGVARLTIDSAGNAAFSGNVTGTWTGNAVGILYGGTGATTAQGARTNLLPSQTGNSGRILTTNGTDVSWTAIGSGGIGDVIGPASSTDNAVVRFDGTTGKLVQNSATTIDDSGNITTDGKVKVGGATGMSIVDEVDAIAFVKNSPTWYGEVRAERYKLANYSHSVVADHNIMTGEWAGGYNLNILGRVTTGESSGVEYKQDGIKWYSETYGVPGPLTPRMTLSPTTLAMNGAITSTGNLTVGTSTISSVAKVMSGAVGTASFLSLFSSGNLEGYIAQTATAMHIGVSGGLVTYNATNAQNNAAITIGSTNNVTFSGFIEIGGSSGPIIRNNSSTIEIRDTTNATFAPLSASTITANGSRPVTISPSNGTISIQGSSGGWANDLRFLGSSGTHLTGFGANGTDNTLNYAYIGTFASPVLTALGTGNVGIGTTAPAARLEVASVNAGSSTRLGFRIDSVRATADLEPHIRFVRTAIAGWNLAQPSSSLTLYLDANSANPEFTFAQGAIFIADGQVKIGNTSGVRLKNSSGLLQIRNDADNAFANIQVSRLTADNANIGRQHFAMGAYSHSNGILVATDIAVSDNAMFEFTIEGNSYNANGPIFARIQGYNYTVSGTIINTYAISTEPTLTFDLFHYNGFVHLWFAQTGAFQTYTCKLISPMFVRHITSVTNAVKPTTGVTNNVTVTPYKIWTQSNDGASSGLDADLLDGQQGSYYAAASSVAGTINYIPKFTSTSAIGNSQIFDNGTWVGIGTTSPTAGYRLSVNGSATFSTYAEASGMRVQSPGSGPDVLMGTGRIAIGGSLGEASFQDRDAAANTDRSIIYSNTGDLRFYRTDDIMLLNSSRVRSNKPLDIHQVGGLTNYTRIARTSDGRLTIYRPNDTSTPAVSFGSGNDELHIRSGLGVIAHSGANFAISATSTSTLSLASASNNVIISAGGASPTVSITTGVLEAHSDIRIDTDNDLMFNRSGQTTASTGRIKWWTSAQFGTSLGPDGTDFTIQNWSNTALRISSSGTTTITNLAGIGTAPVTDVRLALVPGSTSAARITSRIYDYGVSHNDSAGNYEVAYLGGTIGTPTVPVTGHYRNLLTFRTGGTSGSLFGNPSFTIRCTIGAGIGTTLSEVNTSLLVTPVSTGIPINAITMFGQTGLVNIDQGTIQLGSGVRLKNNSGELQVRNSADSAFVAIEAEVFRNLNYTLSDTRLRLGSLEIQPAALNNSAITDNAYYSSGWTRRQTGTASLIYMLNGEIQLRAFPTGTGALPETCQVKLTTGGTFAVGGSMSTTSSSIVGATFTVTSTGAVTASGNITATGRVNSGNGTSFGESGVGNSIQGNDLYIVSADGGNHGRYTMTNAAAGAVFRLGWTTAHGGVSLESVPVASGNTGYLAWFKPSGTRQGYIGFDLGNDITLKVESGGHFVIDGVGARIGLSGPLLKNSSGVLQVRNNADSAFANIEANNIVANGTLSVGSTFTATSGLRVPNGQYVQFADNTGTYANMGMTRLSSGAIRITAPSTTVDFLDGVTNFTSMIRIGSANLIRYNTGNTATEFRTTDNSQFSPVVTGHLSVVEALGGSNATPANTRLRLMTQINAYMAGAISGRTYSANAAHGDIVLSANPSITTLDYSNLTDDLVVRGNTGHVEINRGRLILNDIVNPSSWALKTTYNTEVGQLQFINNSSVARIIVHQSGSTIINGTNAGANFQGLTVQNIAANATGLKTQIRLPVFNGSEGGVIEEIGNSIDGYRLNIYSGQASGVLTFGTGGDNERMRISASGDVGIGATSPLAKFHVRRSSGTHIRIGISDANADTVQGGIDWFSNDAGTPDFFGSLRMRFQGGTGVANRQMQFLVADSATPKMTLDGNGNLTITGTIQVGTSGPILKNNSGLLQVRNSTDTGFASISALIGSFTNTAIPLYAIRTGGTGTDNATLQIGDGTIAGSIFFMRSGGGGNASVGYKETNSTGHFTITSAGGGGFITLDTGAGEAMRVVPARRVLIGTTTDDTTNLLQVAGSTTMTGNLTVGGTFNVTGSITNTYTKTHNLTRTLPATVGDYVDIGTFSFTNGAGLLDIAINVGISANSQAKFYKIPCYYSSTSNNWRKIPSLSASPSYATNDFDLEIRGNAGNTELRIRKTSGTVGGTIRIAITQYGRVDLDTFTASTATGSGGAPTALAAEYHTENLVIRAIGGSTEDLLIVRNNVGSNVARITHAGQFVMANGVNHTSLTDSLTRMIFNTSGTTILRGHGTEIFAVQNNAGSNMLLLGSTGNLTANGNISAGGTSTNCFMFGNLPYFRVAQLVGSNGIVGGYNIEFNGTNVVRNASGSVSGYMYQSNTVNFYAEPSAAPATITPKMTLSDTLLLVNENVRIGDASSNFSTLTIGKSGSHSTLLSNGDVDNNFVIQQASTSTGSMFLDVGTGGLRVRPTGTSTDIFRILNSGNTGIGVNPTARFHVVEGANTFKFNSGASSVTPNISIGTSGGKSVALLVGSAGSTFTFDNTGFFGIAVDSKANIDGGSSNGGTVLLRIENNGSVRFLKDVEHQDSDGLLRFRFNNASSTAFRGYSSNPFSFINAAGSEIVSINQNGVITAGSPFADSKNGTVATTLYAQNLFNNMGLAHASVTDFNSVNDYGFRYVQGNTNGPGTGSSQFYNISLGLGIDYTYSQYAIQLAIPRYNSSDKYISMRTREAGTWGSWQKIAAGTADGLREFTWSGKPAATSTKGPIMITDTVPANTIWTSDGSVWRSQTRTRKVITFATTMTLDSSEAMVQRITATNNFTLNKFTNGFDGASLEVIIRQDGTGGRTLTFGTGFRFNEYITSITLSTGANKTDRILFEYDATDDVWDVISFVKGS